MAHVSNWFKFARINVFGNAFDAHLSEYEHSFFYWFRNSHLANLSHLSNMFCPQRCAARRKVTQNLECFENEEGESGEGNLYCHNCQGQLMHFSTGTLGWTYYWLPHSYKHSADHIFPLSCSIAEKIRWAKRRWISKMRPLGNTFCGHQFAAIASLKNSCLIKTSGFNPFNPFNPFKNKFL